MFKVGDYVFNKKSGDFSQVIGYGHQLLKSGYITTLKVIVAESKTSSLRVFV
jgi:hypothetical protein